MNADVRCPYCVRPIQNCLQTANCPLPFQYDKRAMQANPFWVMAAGFTNHGKTVYLTELTLILDSLGDLLPGFFCDYMSHQPTLDRIRAMRAKGRSRHLAQPTQKTRPEPLFLELNGLPVTKANRAQSRRILVMFDAAGECFSTVDGELQHLDFLPVLSTIWFLVSLKDLQNGQDPVNLSDLFLSYRATMQRAGCDLRNRRIIFVYTKADLLKTQLPQSVIDYLMEDPFQTLNQGAQPTLNAFSLEEYLTKAADVSATLEDFTIKQPGGQQFVALVRREGMDLRFCAVSATGHSPNEQTNRLEEQPTRYRLMDPLFWTLNVPENNSPPVPHGRLTLVLDQPSSGGVSLDSDIVHTLWRAMSARGQTTTHFLGSSRPAGFPGQQPALTANVRPRLPLIGPILDQLGTDDKVMVLTRQVIADLVDFRNSHWKHRLLLGTITEEDIDQWQNTAVIHSTDDCEAITQRLLSLNQQ